MEIIPLELETISPLNYYYIAAAGGMRSSSFLGDIALKYAILHQLGYLNYSEPQKFQPTYKELNDYDFWLTVGVNEKIAFGEGGHTSFMKSMTRNTMHGIDYNGTNLFPNARVGSTMYKNFYFQQPIRPGNKFYCYLLTKSKIDVPQAIRMGNGKNGIIRIKRVSGGNFKAVLNYYSISNIMDMTLPQVELTFAEHLILQYYLAGMFTREVLHNVYAQWSN